MSKQVRENVQLFQRLSLRDKASILQEILDRLPVSHLLCLKRHAKKRALLGASEGMSREQLEFKKQT